MIVIGPLTTLSPDSLSGTMPLPVREAQVGATAGHLVQATDWATLAELFGERVSTVVAGPFKVYPTGCVNEALEPDYYTGGCSAMVDDLAELAAGRHLDPDWTPQGGEGGWDYGSGREGQSHLWRRCSPRLTANRPRGLDDLRRVYYDAKKMTRRSIGFQASYTVGAQSGAGYYPYVSQTGTSSPVLSSCDAARAIVNWAEIPQAVRDDSRFASAPAFAMVDFWARKTDARGAVSTAQQHLPTTIDANGNAALTGWNADGVLAFLRAKFGQGQSGCTYEAAALLTAVYYDVHYPIDGILAPWHWQPES